MLDEAFRDDPRHDLGRVVLSLAAIAALRAGVGEVFGRGGREAVGRIGHAGTVAWSREQDRNTELAQENWTER